MYSFKRLFSLLICIIFISLISCKSGGDSPTAPTSTGGSINGKVVDINGNGVTGVTIRFQFSNQIYTKMTDSNGNFSISFFENGTYTVTPSLYYYDFSPSSAQIQINDNDITDVNFTKLAIDLKFSPLSSEIAEAGQTTVVNVVVEKASRLISARFIISFNASLVEVTNIETGGTGFIFTDAGVSVIDAEKTYDNVNGSIVVGVGGLKQNFTGVGGNGILASITFKGKTSGTGNLSFDTTQSNNIVLINYSPNVVGGEKETINTHDGTITVR